jgi:hypothetical protein
MNTDLSFLDREAEGLDFSDPEDRAIFRTRVAERLKITKVRCMDKWTGCHSRTRTTAIFRVANLYISRQVRA